MEKSQNSRADARRNRDSLIQVAKAAFLELGPETSLNEIAKRAGVGPGTLYRHFPTRESLLEVVYEAEVEALLEASERFRRELPPADAVRAWLVHFINLLATKKVIAPALASESTVIQDNMAKTHAALRSLFARAVEAGELRADADPIDLLRAIVGVTYFCPQDQSQDAAIRLVEILMAGCRVV